MFSFAFDAICTQQSTFWYTTGRLGTQKSTENTTERIGTQQSTFRDTTGRMGTQQSTENTTGRIGTQQSTFKDTTEYREHNGAQRYTTEYF